MAPMQPLDAPATLEGATAMNAPAPAPEMPLQVLVLETLQHLNHKGKPGTQPFGQHGDPIASPLLMQCLCNSDIGPQKHKI